MQSQRIDFVQTFFRNRLATLKHLLRGCLKRGFTRINRNTRTSVGKLKLPYCGCPSSVFPVLKRGPENFSNIL
jgi:hypothetical protein